MSKNLTRREFLKLTGTTGSAFLLVSCTADKQDQAEQTFWDRLIGRSRTQPPTIEQSWSYADGKLTLDLTKLPEIKSLGSAVRLEGEALADPVLIVLGDDGNYYSFLNACSHAGRMIDPITGSMTLECCSLSKSTYDYEGNVLSGPAEEPLQCFPLVVEGNMLIVEIG